jgi:hypothetical protein
VSSEHLERRAQDAARSADLCGHYQTATTIRDLVQAVLDLRRTLGGVMGQNAKLNAELEQAKTNTGPEPDAPKMARHAAAIAANLRKHWPELDDKGFQQQQAMVVAEEAGEFLGAARRWLGLARRTGTYEEMSAELADVEIASYVGAQAFGIDLDA